VGQDNLGGEDEMVVEAGDKEEQKFLLSKNGKTITNCGIPDQSECVVGEKKLLDEVFEFVEMTSGPIFHSTLPVINFNLEEKPVDIFIGSLNIPSRAPTIVPDKAFGAYLKSAEDRITNAADPVAHIVSSPAVMLASAPLGYPPKLMAGLNMAVEALPEYLHHAKDSEESAWDLQGLIFHDDELGWCTITDWGVEHGTNIVFYAPVGSLNPGSDER
jgi:hypothetical protein